MTPPSTAAVRAHRRARPFPLADLETALRIRSGKPAHPPHLVGSCTNCSHDFCFNTRTVADLLGVDKRQVHRWRETGLNERQADTLAAFVDLHPAEVWAEVWWTVTGAA